VKGWDRAEGERGAMLHSGGGDGAFVRSGEGSVGVARGNGEKGEGGGGLDEGWVLSRG
jgi:hypothetical protein